MESATPSNNGIVQRARPILATVLGVAAGLAFMFLVDELISKPVGWLICKLGHGQIIPFMKSYDFMPLQAIKELPIPIGLNKVYFGIEFYSTVIGTFLAYYIAVWISQKIASNAKRQRVALGLIAAYGFCFSMWILYGAIDRYSEDVLLSMAEWAGPIFLTIALAWPRGIALGRRHVDPSTSS